jgi:carbon-monoxide dehydrogenase iron sulfur subunit
MEKIREGEVKKRVFVDRNLCTGCRYCEAVCSLVHSREKQVNPREGRIIVHQDIPNARFDPIVCKQCDKAACVEACPFDAIPIDPQLGIPTIDIEKCTGCAACVEACPFGAMFFDGHRGVAMKCDLCAGDPQCVKFCRALPHIGHAALSFMTAEEWPRSRTGLKLTQQED